MKNYKRWKRRCRGSDGSPQDGVEAGSSVTLLVRGELSGRRAEQVNI